MTIKDDIEKHTIFTNSLNLYILECLENGTTPEQIQDSLNLFVKEQTEKYQKLSAN